MALPRGFKAAANRISLGLRRLLAISKCAPFDLPALASRLGLELVPVTNFSDACSDEVRRLARDNSFSALLLPLGNGRRIVLYNDTSSPGRKNSDLAHEISHALLAHSPMPLLGGSGGRNFDQNQEEEANCLASYILLPNEAARHIVYTCQSPEQACRDYGVSRQMLEFRLNASGARLQHKRWQRKHRPRGSDT